jgi:uncharacterized protein (DUF433 family)
MLTISAETPPLIPSDGIIYVGKTRVTLDTVVASFSEGATVEGIVQQYPALSLADAYSAIAFYLSHKSEVEAYLTSGQEASQRVKTENEARFNPVGIRARLLARRNSK